MLGYIVIVVMAYKRKIFEWRYDDIMYYYYKSCEYHLGIHDDGMITGEVVEDREAGLYHITDEVCIDPEVRRLLELVYFVANG